MQVHDCVPTISAFSKYFGRRGSNSVPMPMIGTMYRRKAIYSVPLQRTNQPARRPWRSFPLGRGRRVVRLHQPRHGPRHEPIPPERHRHDVHRHDDFAIGLRRVAAEQRLYHHAVTHAHDIDFVLVIPAWSGQRNASADGFLMTTGAGCAARNTSGRPTATAARIATGLSSMISSLPQPWDWDVCYPESSCQYQDNKNDHNDPDNVVNNTGMSRCQLPKHPDSEESNKYDSSDDDEECHHL